MGNCCTSKQLQEKPKKKSDKNQELQNEYQLKQNNVIENNNSAQQHTNFKSTQNEDLSQLQKLEQNQVQDKYQIQLNLIEKDEIKENCQNLNNQQKNVSIEFEKQIKLYDIKLDNLNQQQKTSNLIKQTATNDQEQSSKKDIPSLQRIALDRFKDSKSSKRLSSPGSTKIKVQKKVQENMFEIEKVPNENDYKIYMGDCIEEKIDPNNDIIIENQLPNDGFIEDDIISEPEVVYQNPQNNNNINIQNQQIQQQQQQDPKKINKLILKKFKEDNNKSDNCDEEKGDESQSSVIQEQSDFKEDTIYNMKKQEFRNSFEIIELEKRKSHNSQDKKSRKIQNNQSNGQENCVSHKYQYPTDKYLFQSGHLLKNSSPREDFYQRKKTKTQYVKN